MSVDAGPKKAAVSMDKSGHLAAMKGLSLFSGIGGLDLCARWAGIETVGFCEIEPFPVEILKRRWPNVPIVDDVRTVHGDGWEAVDIVFGGFPCQDLSVAGKQGGLWDEEGRPTRSGLWFEMLRVIHEVRPRWVVAENVRGAVNKALDTVQSSLEDEGYQVWNLVIPASAVGAPHQRERLFVVGAREDVADSITERLQGCEWGCPFSEQGPPTSKSTPQCSEGGEPWTTPNACGNYNRKGASATSGDRLASQVKKLWPTPRANKVSGYSSTGYGQTLPQAVDVLQWRTPDANSSRGASSAERYQWKLENGMPISINDQVAHEGGNVGQLNPDWVECLMGFPIGWTNPDCDVPEPWPGWPAAMSKRLWMTPKAGACGMTAKTKGRPLEMSTHLPTQTFVAERDCVDQHPYEPPRTGVKIPNRAKRLKALGNAVVPQQAYPLFRAIAEMERMTRESEVA